PIAVFYHDDAFRAISDICNHCGGPLSEGRMRGEFVMSLARGGIQHRDRQGARRGRRGAGARVPGGVPRRWGLRPDPSGASPSSSEDTYSKASHACTRPCAITERDPGDQLTPVYERLVHWGDVVLIATPIRWGNASSLYFRMIERLNCIHKQITINNKSRS